MICTNQILFERTEEQEKFLDHMLTTLFNMLIEREEPPTPEKNIVNVGTPIVPTFPELTPLCKDIRKIIYEKEDCSS